MGKTSVVLQEWLTPSQAASILQVSAITVKRWVSAGRLVGQATPLGVLIDADAVEALFQERTAAAGQEGKPAGEEASNG